MGKSKKSQSGFSLEGQFVGYVVEEGHKIRLRLVTAEGECLIKLSKDTRMTLKRALVLGDWVSIEGTQKFDSDNAVKRKAYSIVPKTSVNPDPHLSRSKETILVCQKPGCLKRGGQAVCQALEMALSDRGLEDQVTIKGTGCLKNCSQGPNVVMPGKARYCKIDAKQIPGLVDKHFPEVDLSEEWVEKVRELQPIG